MCDRILTISACTVFITARVIIQCIGVDYFADDYAEISSVPTLPIDFITFLSLGADLLCVVYFLDHDRRLVSVRLQHAGD